ncbi:NB-ARC domain-containing protein [Leptothoe sp. EHU-05/26/07-4]
MHYGNPYPTTLNPGAPFQSPPLPRHYVERPEALEAVKNLLLNESTPGTLVISAIYGMGGIGKSVLAAALVREPEVQERFPDGVLWVTLGQQPDLLPMVHEWIQLLGDYEYKPTNLQAASLHLRTLLADKKALLAIDDVWHPEHMEPFRIGGAGCCVLVTTRQTQMIGAIRYDLDLMTPQQSLELLTKYLPNALSTTEQAQARAFAKEVGFLPLALELAAAQIEDEVTWDKLLETFREEMDALDLDSDMDTISDEATRKQRSLVASLKLTLKLLSPKQLEQFAWFGILPEDVVLTQKMGENLWGVKASESGQLLREFRKRSLLLPQTQNLDENDATYRIHDLVHDLAKNLLTRDRYLGDLKGLGLTMQEAHSQFLERYHFQTQDGLWHTIPYDGYIHNHLGWHFEQSGQPELLHQLLKESTSEGRNGWYETCAQLGPKVNFVTDTTRAWQCAEALYEQNSTESIVLQCRYTLIATSLNSLAQNIPSQLIAVFVKQKIWKPAQGLVYVEQCQSSSQRADGLTQLAPYLPEVLMSKALDVARSIPDESCRARALSELAKHLPGPLISEVLSMARLMQNKFSQAFVFSRLASHLPEAQLKEALEIVRSIQDESSQVGFLFRLAPYLPKAQLSEALNALSLQSESHRVIALIALAQLLSNDILSEVYLREALEIVYVMQNESSWVSQTFWSGPEALLSGYLGLHALAGRLDIRFSSKADALRELAPYLSEAQLNDVLKMVGRMQNEASQVDALFGLAPHLSTAQLSKALEIVRLMQDEASQGNALFVLALRLSEAQLNDALKMVGRMRDEASQVNALYRLAPYLSKKDLMSRALDIVRSMHNESSQGSSLRWLAPYLSEKDLMSRALDIIRSMPSKIIQSHTLDKLARYLPEDLSSKDLGMLCSMQHEYGYGQVQVLIGLIPHLSDGLSEALEAVSLLQDESFQVSALSRLAQYLSQESMSKALGIVRSMRSEAAQSDALCGLAQYLSKTGSMSKALGIVRSMRSEAAQSDALCGLAQYLSTVELNKVLEMVRSMQQSKDSSSQAKALVGLAPYLSSEELLRKALDVVCSIQSKSAQSNVLLKGSQYLLSSKELLRKASNMVRSIQDEFSQTNTLRELAPYLSAGLRSKALATLYLTPQKVSRKDTQNKLGWYLPKSLSSKILEAAFSIQDESFRIKILINLAPYLHEDNLRQGFEIVCSMQHYTQYSPRTIALCELAPYLSEELLRKALAMLDQDKFSQVDALYGLAPYLSKELLGEALKIAYLIHDESSRIDALCGLLPTLKIIEKDFVVLKEVLHTLACRDRKAFLADIPKLAPAIISLSGGDTKALELVVDEIRDVCRQWP